uniref:Uncharacterized protein n=1 Tax=Meloidogyne enterolobii TaxID=390850 RepID=A0A6V7WSD0_MELEN|nr:unnamed protein product [Meloidogyne enterolobii]
MVFVIAIQLINIHKEDYHKLDSVETPLINDKNYSAALKGYIENLRLPYIHRFSIFDNHDDSNEDNNITLSEMQYSLQDTKKILSLMQQSLDQGNKTLSELHADIEENKIKLAEMSQLQGEMFIGKNRTTSSEFSSLTQQSSNNS